MTTNTVTVRRKGDPQHNKKRPATPSRHPFLDELRYYFKLNQSEGCQLYLENIKQKLQNMFLYTDTTYENRSHFWNIFPKTSQIISKIALNLFIYAETKTQQQHRIRIPNLEWQFLIQQHTNNIKTLSIFRKNIITNRTLSKQIYIFSFSILQICILHIWYILYFLYIIFFCIFYKIQIKSERGLPIDMFRSLGALRKGVRLGCPVCLSVFLCPDAPWRPSLADRRAGRPSQQF